MSKKLACMILCTLLMTALLAFAAQDTRAAPGGGPANPIIINDLTDLDDMRNDLSAHYRLGNDIDASATSLWNGGAGWEPIGTDTHPFKGTLEGNGHEIHGLFIDRGDENNVGLFGSTSQSQITGVALIGLNVSGSDGVGGLVGENKGLISGSYVSGEISGNNRVGGLVGDNKEAALISSSSADANVSGNYNVGGLIGNNHGSEVKRSDSAGHVLGNWYVGGLIGNNGGGSEVLRSHSAVELSGSNCVGGLVGINLGSTIAESFAVGNVSANNRAGGLVGENSGGTIERSYAAGPVVASGSTVGGLLGGIISGTVAQSYWDMESTGQAESAGEGSAPAHGMTTAEMMQQATFAGWDFDQVWDIDEGVTYPQLRASVSLTSIWVEEEPLRMVYDYGEELDLSGLVAGLGWSDHTVGMAGLHELEANGLSVCTADGTVLDENHAGLVINVSHTDGLYAHLPALTIQMVTVKGMVVDHGGSPMADAEVHVMDEDGRKVLVVTTDGNGEFEFLHAPGTLTLQAKMQGHDIPSQTFEAASGSLDIELAGLPSEGDGHWIGLVAVLLLAILLPLAYRRFKDGED